MAPDKHRLYELSVQSPVTHAKWFADLFREVTKRDAVDLREDFCGTFKMSCEWVKLNPKNRALGLDLDPEPLNYGKKKNHAKLTSDQQKRVSLIQQDVLKPCPRPSDMIIACNFSFFIFKQRDLLRQYFKSCLKGLKPGGVLLLEAAGGPGMIRSMRETKTVKFGKDKKFKYTWHQKSFDPITHDAKYAIHFKLWDGTVLNNVFTYDWRLWSIPELREILLEAGFSKAIVYWETEYKGTATGEFAPAEKGDNAFAWIAYILGVK